MKIYAVKVGRKPGIYLTWSDCQEQINGFSNAKFKSFSSYDEAHNFLNFQESWRHIKAPTYKYIDCNSLFTLSNNDFHLNNNVIDLIQTTFTIPTETILINYLQEHEIEQHSLHKINNSTTAIYKILTHNFQTFMQDTFFKTLESQIHDIMFQSKQNNNTYINKPTISPLI